MTILLIRIATVIIWVVTFLIIIFGTIAVGWQNGFYVSLILTVISMVSLIISLFIGRNSNEVS